MDREIAYLERNVVAFVNDEYKDEWLEYVPNFGNGKVRYADATYIRLEDGSKQVYDGATNLMGHVLADGTLKPLEEGYEYQLSFLRCAAKN